MTKKRGQETKRGEEEPLLKPREERNGSRSRWVFPEFPKRGIFRSIFSPCGCGKEKPPAEIIIDAPRQRRK